MFSDSPKKYYINYFVLAYAQFEIVFTIMPPNV